MQDKRHNYLVLTLSGCLITLILIMCLGTTVLTGIYLYDRYGLPDFPVAEAIFGEALPITTPEAQIQQPALATLAPPVVSLGVLPTPTLAQPEASVETIPLPTAEPLSDALDTSLPVTLDQYPIPNNAHAYLERLYLADHPAHDYYDSAVRLGKLDAGPRNFSKPGYSEGATQVFKTEEGDVTATLMAVTEHAYFWVDDNLSVSKEAIELAAGKLEEEYYARVNHLFGQPWAPGIDGDPRFSVLHLASVGNRYELGFFSDQDEYPKSLFNDSNEQEIVYLNMGQLELGSELYFGTLVHELQHLFQWNLDKNEATWFNEGMSQLAEIYAGLDTVSPSPYLEQPDVRLNSWSYEDHLIDAHYAASFLFLAYTWEQLGEAAIYELVRHPANGLVAVRNVLQGFQPDRSLHDFLADWAVATYLDDPFAGEQFSYDRLDLTEPAYQTRVSQLPASDLRELDQFAVHYIDLDRSGPVTITFAGDTTARLVDSAPTSGEQMWYALPSNDSDAQLTARFDLTQLDRATLTFSAWYDLEKDYDFAYVSVSPDQGKTWSLLQLQHSQTGNYGPALSGKSSDAPDAVNGWVRETVSLNQFTGNEILIRYHVLTDFETIGRGFALDDIAIAELGFFDNADSGTGSWDAQGFVRTGWLLPQQWAVRLIVHDLQPRVIPLSLNQLNQVRHSETLGAEGGTLVVMPLTPFVDETAQYWLQID